ncbi:MAG: serine hydrolase [Clostridiales bacterium]|nr:serine hydrolase [Clostridiales bacterium]
MKKTIIFLISAVIIVISAPFPRANASYNKFLKDMTLYADIFLLESIEDGTIIFEKNTREKTAPASLTKITTAIVTLENCGDLNKTVTVPEYVIRMFDGTGSSNVGMKPGEQMSVLNLLYCMLVPSANEAAAALADHIGGGSIDAFVGMMNDFVKKIGCTGTHFVNPHGLDADEQYTTAADIAKITKYALTFDHSDLFEKITTTREYTVPSTNLSAERKIVSTNFMMSSGYAEYYCKYVSGIKTGSTENAGKCVVAKAAGDGYSYLAVVMKGSFDDVDRDGYRENGAFMTAKALIDWTFSNISFETILPASRIIAEMPVRLSSKSDYVGLCAIEDVSTFVPKGAEENSVLVLPDDSVTPESVDAPVKKGQKLGQAVIYYGGEEIARTDIAAVQDVDRNLFLYVGSLIGKLFSIFAFRMIFFALVAVLVIYIFLKFRNMKKRRDHGRDMHIVDFRSYK